MTLRDTTPLQHATVQDATAQDTTAHFTHDTTPQRLQPVTHVTRQHKYNSITLQRWLQLHDTPLHPAGVGEVTAPTGATNPKSTSPTLLSELTTN